MKTKFIQRYGILLLAILGITFAGLTGEADASTCITASGICLPIGHCTGTNVIQNLDLENRSYGLEEARVLRALSFSEATMIQSFREGSENGRFMTLVTNVKDKVRMFREDFDTELQSEATGGRGATDCGPFKPAGKWRKLTDRFLVVQYVYVEAEICYKTLIGTFKQNLLNAGATRSEQNDAINEMLLSDMIKNNNIQFDKLIWNGDYKAAERKIAHFDGLVKKAALAIGGSVAQDNDYLIAGMQAGDYIEGIAGGFDIKVPFNTSIVVTVADLDTVLSGLNDEFGVALFTVSNNGSDTVNVVANTAGKPIDLLLVMTDGTGLNDCDEALVPGAGTISETVVVANVDFDSPLTIPFVTITSGNVIAQMESLYSLISIQAPWLKDNASFRVHVASNVWTAMTIALTKQREDFRGVSELITDGPFGLPVVEQKYLKQGVIFASFRENLFFGTDLVSDLDTPQQWVNIECQKVRLRFEMFAGVQIDYMGDVACNLDGHPFQFQPAQPE